MFVGQFANVLFLSLSDMKNSDRKWSTSLLVTVSYINLCQIVQVKLPLTEQLFISKSECEVCLNETINDKKLICSYVIFFRNSVWHATKPSDFLWLYFEVSFLLSVGIRAEHEFASICYGMSWNQNQAGARLDSGIWSRRGIRGTLRYSNVVQLGSKRLELTWTFDPDVWL